MLTLTPIAADAVRHLVASARASSEPHAGIRISPGVPGPTGTPLEVALADEPEATDQTIEEAGATLFVEETAAEFLEDKILDATVEADGSASPFLSRERALRARASSRSSPH